MKLLSEDAPRLLVIKIQIQAVCRHPCCEKYLVKRITSKGQLISKGNLVSSILPKNELENLNF